MIYNKYRKRTHILIIYCSENNVYDIWTIDTYSRSSKRLIQKQKRLKNTLSMAYYDYKLVDFKP